MKPFTIINNGDYVRTDRCPEHEDGNAFVGCFWAFVVYGCLASIGGIVGLALHFLCGGV